jgi:hypothetical protein
LHPTIDPITNTTKRARRLPVKICGHRPLISLQILWRLRRLSCDSPVFFFGDASYLQCRKSSHAPVQLLIFTFHSPSARYSLPPRAVNPPCGSPSLHYHHLDAWLQRHFFLFDLCCLSLKLFAMGLFACGKLLDCLLLLASPQGLIATFVIAAVTVSTKEF